MNAAATAAATADTATAASTPAAAATTRCQNQDPVQRLARKLRLSLVKVDVAARRRQGVIVHSSTI